MLRKTRTDICRTCLSTEGEYVSMFSDSSDTASLPNKIMTVSNIVIHKLDNLPRTVCKKCVFLIESFYCYKKQIESANRHLKSLLSKRNNPESRKEEKEDDSEWEIQYVSDEVKREVEDAFRKKEDNFRRKELEEIRDTLKKLTEIVFIPVNKSIYANIGKSPKKKVSFALDECYEEKATETEIAQSILEKIMEKEEKKTDSEAEKEITQNEEGQETIEDSLESVESRLTDPMKIDEIIPEKIFPSAETCGNLKENLELENFATTLHPENSSSKVMEEVPRLEEKDPIDCSNLEKPMESEEMILHVDKENGDERETLELEKSKEIDGKAFHEFACENCGESLGLEIEEISHENREYSPNNEEVNSRLEIVIEIGQKTDELEKPDYEGQEETIEAENAKEIDQNADEFNETASSNEKESFVVDELNFIEETVIEPIETNFTEEEQDDAPQIPEKHQENRFDCQEEIMMIEKLDTANEVIFGPENLVIDEKTPELESEKSNESFESDNEPTRILCDNEKEIVESENPEVEQTSFHSEKPDYVRDNEIFDSERLYIDETSFELFKPDEDNEKDNLESENSQNSSKELENIEEENLKPEKSVCENQDEIQQFDKNVQSKMIESEELGCGEILETEESNTIGAEILIPCEIECENVLEIVETPEYDEISSASNCDINDDEAMETEICENEENIVEETIHEPFEIEKNNSETDKIEENKIQSKEIEEQLENLNENLPDFEKLQEIVEKNGPSENQIAIETSIERINDKVTKNDDDENKENKIKVKVIGKSNEEIIIISSDSSDDERRKMAEKMPRRKTNRTLRRNINQAQLALMIGRHFDFKRNQNRGGSVRNTVKTEMKDLSRKYFQCTSCNISIYSVVAVLQHHYKNHTSANDFLCKICEIRFPNETTLQEHFDQHDESNLYHCAICNGEFVLKKNYRTHLNSHARPKIVEPEMKRQKMDENAAKIANKENIICNFNVNSSLK